MHPPGQKIAFLFVLFMSGCATVDPYPPVTGESQLYHDTLLAHAPSQSAIINPLRTVIGLQEVNIEDPSLQPAYPESFTSDGAQLVYTYADEFWERVRSNFLLGDNARHAVKKQAADYAKHGYEVVRTLRRGEPYLAYILDEVEKYGLPGEVVLLPFIESRYDPFAVSHGRAAGLWQFIPSTGEYFGLDQDWWHDERRDIVASTEAALRYLSKLHREFKGDWLLTFAAYNAGGGTVRNAIKRNRKAGKPVDFWHLDLPAETTAYVPKLLGICRLINDPDRYGIELPFIDNTPYFDVVETGKQLDIKVAAELAGMDPNELIAFNPRFNRWSTHPDGPHYLVIPVEKAEIFAANLINLPPQEQANWTWHETRRGETLSHIAARYQTTIAELQRFNKLTSTRILAGKRLLVPLAGENASIYTTRNRHVPEQEAPGEAISHEVNPGDSLWLIAKRYQVPLAELKEWNQLDAESLIRPGQQLIIRAQDADASAGNHMRTINYTVRSGDSLYLISKKYRVSIADLQRWNDLDRENYLQPGQKIKIHVDPTRLTKT